MSKTDLSGVWGFKGTSQLAKLTELQGYREKSKKNVKPPTPPCTEPLKRYVSSVLVAALHRDGNIRLCPQHTQRRPSNSCERPRTFRSKFSPFWRNWVDSGVNCSVSDASFLGKELRCQLAIQLFSTGRARYYDSLPAKSFFRTTVSGGGSILAVDFRWCLKTPTSSPLCAVLIHIVSALAVCVAPAANREQAQTASALTMRLVVELCVSEMQPNNDENLPLNAP